MSIPLALADARRNCDRDGATAVLTLKGSGVRIEGRLKEAPGGFHVAEAVSVESIDGGWSTVLISEVAAVTAKPRERF